MPKAVTWFSVMPGLSSLGEFVVQAVADGADDAHRLLLVAFFIRTRFHHRRWPRPPRCIPARSKAPDHVDVDKVHAERQVPDASFLQGGDDVRAMNLST